MNRADQEITILDAKGATGVGALVDVSDYKHIIASIGTDGGGDADLTMKCVGSIAEKPPTFTDAQSVTNLYEFIGMYNYDDATLTKGNKGFVVATADKYRLYVINVDGLKWLTFRVTARSQGEVTVKIRPFNNN